MDNLQRVSRSEVIVGMIISQMIMNEAIFSITESSSNSSTKIKLVN